MIFRKFLLQTLALLLAFLPVLAVCADHTYAATSRVAIIKELTGSVLVKKSGGSKPFKAFAKMSLNEGDVVTTSANSTAVLQFANGTSEDDKMSVAANTTLTFSKLSDRKGTVTKVSMFNGSAWVDVKSIASKNDEFTLETPTAIMGVRGTHLLVSVDPVTGATKLTVAAGIVNTQATGSSESFDVMPGDNALITQDEEDQSAITIAPADLALLMKQSDKSIVEAILQASADIAEENKNKLDQYFAESGSEDPNETNRKKLNVDNLLGAIVDSAVKSGLVTEERANELVALAEQRTGTKIDLSKKDQILSDEDKRKQEEQRKKDLDAANKAEDARKAAEEERKKNESLNLKLDTDRKQREEESKNAEEEKKRKAEEEYQKQLPDAEKQRFDDDKRKRTTESEPRTQPATTTSETAATTTRDDRIPLSGNARLQSMTVTGYTYSSASPAPVTVTQNDPLGSPNLFNATVTDDVYQVTVTLVTNNSGAIVKYNDTVLVSNQTAKLDLNASGTTDFQFVVTAPNGNSQTYTLSVLRLTLTVPPAAFSGYLTEWATADKNGTPMDWHPSSLDPTYLVTRIGETADSFGIAMNLNPSTYKIRFYPFLLFPLTVLAEWSSNGARTISGIAPGSVAYTMTAVDTDNVITALWILVVTRGIPPLNIPSVSGKPVVQTGPTTYLSNADVNQTNADFTAIVNPSYDGAVNSINGAVSTSGPYSVPLSVAGVNDITIGVKDFAGTYEDTHTLKVFKGDTSAFDPTISVAYKGNTIKVDNSNLVIVTDQRVSAIALNITQPNLIPPNATQADVYRNGVMLTNLTNITLNNGNNFFDIVVHAGKETDGWWIRRINIQRALP